MRVEPVRTLRGELTVPGDKSISHRAVLLGALAEGRTEITGFLPGADCLSTIACLRRLGVAIEQEGDRVTVHGAGWYALREPEDVLDVGNSGTTIRLLAGVLATQPFHSVLVGDASIARRPMRRVTAPLRAMGAHIDGRADGEYTPLAIRGGPLSAIHHVSPVASAQVKSALLLAGLQADGETAVTEPQRSRDHTERMLQAFGAELTLCGTTVRVRGGQRLTGQRVEVPGDISSAAFFLVAAALVPGSDLVVRGVGLNPTRTGILDVLKAMGAEVEVEETGEACGEPVGDVRVRHAPLAATAIGGDLIPRLIDELPVIAVLATQAEGVTVIRDAQELRVKETDRIATVVAELSKMGARIEATPDGMIIHGPTPLVGARCDSYGDHRIGMALAVAGLIADGPTEIARAEAVAVSFPDFFDRLRTVAR